MANATAYITQKKQVLEEAQTVRRNIEANLARIEEQNLHIDSLLRNVENMQLPKKEENVEKPQSRCRINAGVIAILVGIIFLGVAAFGAVGLFSDINSLPQGLSHAMGTIGHSGKWPFWIFLGGGSFLGAMLLTLGARIVRSDS